VDLQALIERWRRWRNRQVWELEELGLSGMEPSHRPGHPVYRENPDLDARDDTARRFRKDSPNAGPDAGRG